MLQDNIDLQCSTPREREGFSETDSTQYCNSKKHRNQEEAQLLTTPPMHQIELIGSIKRLFKKDRHEHKAQSEDKQTRSIQKDEGRRNTKARESHTTVKKKSVILYFAFMNIVLEIQTKSQLSQNSKLKMHLKQELVLTQRVSPCKVETVFTISGPKPPH